MKETVGKLSEKVGNNFCVCLFAGLICCIVRFCRFGNLFPISAYCFKQMKIYWCFALEFLVYELVILECGVGKR